MPLLAAAPRGLRLPIAAAVAAAAVSLVPAPAQAALEWTAQPYQRVSQAETNGDLARVAADAQGNAVLAWREAASGKNRIRIATRTPGEYCAGSRSRTAATRRMAVRTRAGRAVAVAADGSAIVVWGRVASVNMTNVRLVKGVYGSRLGAWSAVETVAQGGSPNVAMDPQGQRHRRLARGLRHQGAGAGRRAALRAHRHGLHPEPGATGRPCCSSSWSRWTRTATRWSRGRTQRPRRQRPPGREVRSAQRPPAGHGKPSKLLTTRQSFENYVLPRRRRDPQRDRAGDGPANRARHGDLHAARGTGELRGEPVLRVRPYGTDAGGVTFDPAGNALAVFARDRQAGANRVPAYRPAGGVWGPLTDLSGAPNPNLVLRPVSTRPATSAGRLDDPRRQREPGGSIPRRASPARAQHSARRR